MPDASLPGALPDVLSCDGESVYLRHLRFDRSGQLQPGAAEHLFSSAGFLDDGNYGSLEVGSTLALDMYARNQSFR